MPDEILRNYAATQTAIETAGNTAQRPKGAIQLVVVSKTQGVEKIEPLLRAGHRVFGENRVQEAIAKWPVLKQNYPDIQLHLIGPLQSNKAAEAVALFDVIETVDRDKLAAALAAEMAKQGRAPKLLVQVNTGREQQKAGIAPEQLRDFLDRVKTLHGLPVHGLMCIPPVNDSPAKHFSILAELAKTSGLALLSMGMSSDYREAVACGATHVRVGSAIFGERPTTAPGTAK